MLRRLGAALESAKGEGARLAEEARTAAVAPLRSELTQIKAALEAAHAAYAADIAQVHHKTRIPVSMAPKQRSETPVWMTFQEDKID